MAFDYLIVGAGLYGAVFAHEMTARGKKCLVIDKRDHIGGNIYTVEKDGIMIHRYGAHIFHTSDEKVWAYINQFATFNHFVNSPVAVYHDELYNMPFNMNTFSKMWGIRTPAEAKAIIASQIAESGITEPKNLEEQAISLVGRDVYEKLVKGYTEKQWGRSCTDLPAFIIKRLPLRFTYDNNYFRDPHQGIPEEGYTAIIEKLLEGSEVMLGVDGRDYMAEHPDAAERIIYTGMIDGYYDYCFGHLAYRSVRFEDEYPDTDNYQGCAVVNYTAREVPWTRIIEHKHFVYGTQPNTITSKEYPSEWHPGDEPYYPVNNEENNALYQKYVKLAARDKHVRFGGRLGTYRYYDMDKVIAQALADVEDETAKMK